MMMPVRVGPNGMCDATVETCVSRPAMLMIGVAIPPDMMTELAAKDRYPGIQGHNHQWAVIRGIEEAAGRPMDLLSVAAIGDYPRHPALVMRGGHWRHRPGATDVWLPFVNVFPFKQMTCFLVVWAGVLRWLWRHRRYRQRVVFFYNTQSAQFYAMLLATLFVTACKIAIMTDPPSVDLPGEGLIRRIAAEWIEGFSALR